MKLVKQELFTKCCGQCTVATILEKTLDEVVAAYGHDSTSDMHEAKWVMEDQFGVACGDVVHVDNRRKWELPHTAMVRICTTGRSVGHFVAYHDGLFLDPCLDEPMTKQELLDYYNEGKGKRNKVRITHYLEVTAC